MAQRRSFLYLPPTRSGGRLPQHTRAKTVVLDAFDEAVFSLALREAFPTVLIIEKYDDNNPPAKLREVETIADCEYNPHIILVPIVEPAEESKRKQSRTTWQWFGYDRSRWDYGGGAYGDRKWAYDPPTLEEGRLITSWVYGDDVALRTIRKVWRIMSKVTTNLIRQDFRVSDWFGFHAMEWCAQRPRRMLAGRIRPGEGYGRPSSAWYENLRQKVIDRYGNALEDPGPPEIIERDTDVPINSDNAGRNLR